MLAVVTLGNLFLSEVKKPGNKHTPWYVPYFTLQGSMVLATVLSVPILLGLIRK